MVAAAGADMAAVEHELLGGKADLARLLVQLLGTRDLVGPVGGRVDVDLDHAGIGGDGEMQQAVVLGRQIAFEDNLAASLGGRRLDRGGQVSQSSTS